MDLNAIFDILLPSNSGAEASGIEAKILSI